MDKKLITACLAQFALAAFLLPAIASATTNPTLTEPTGTILDPTGKTCTTGLPGICITATNIGAMKLKTGGATLWECTTASMTGALSKNTDTESEGTIHTAIFSGTGTSGKCTTNFGGDATIDTNLGNGTPWCLRSTSTMAADEFQVRGNACSGEVRSITFVLTTALTGNCKYNRTAAMKGTYKTDTSPDNSDAILSLAEGANTEFAKEEGGAFCPASGSLEMSFTLETDTTVSSDPVYFS
jgi:hypothetical protein